MQTVKDFVYTRNFFFLWSSLQKKKKGKERKNEDEEEEKKWEILTAIEFHLNIFSFFH